MADDSEAWKGEPEKPPSYSMFSLFGMMTPEQVAAHEAQQKAAAIERKASAEMRALLVAAYNPAAVCVKCKGAETKTRYCAGEEGGLSYAECYKDTAGHGHFHRTCKHCKHVWYEWPLDHA